MTDVALAGGGRGSITFWDCRSDAQLATFTETHEDDVVQVLRIYNCILFMLLYQRCRLLVFLFQDDLIITNENDDDVEIMIILGQAW